MNFKDLSFVLFLLVFFFVLLDTSYALYVDAPNPYYTAWDFHTCYVESFDALACSNGAYGYYPPLSIIIGKFVGLRFLFLIVISLLFLLIGLAADSWLAPFFYWFVGWPWVYTALKGGLLPFMSVTLILVAAIAFWRFFPKLVKLLFFLLCIFTHNLAGWFAVSCLLVLELYKDDLNTALRLMLLGSLFCFFLGLYFFSGVDTVEYRAIWMVILFFSLLAGRGLSL